MKYKIKDNLTKNLIHSLCSKIFHNSVQYGVINLDRLSDSALFYEYEITYQKRSFTNLFRPRIIIEFFDSPFKRLISQLSNTQLDSIIVSFTLPNNDHQVKVNFQNVNLTEYLDQFVEFEQKIVDQLREIERRYLAAQEEKAKHDKNRK